MNIPFVTDNDTGCEHNEIEVFENGSPVSDASRDEDTIIITVRQNYAKRCTNPECNYTQLNVSEDGEYPSFGNVLGKYEIPRDELEDYKIE